MNADIAENHATIVASVACLKSLPCWKVGCGGSVGSSFRLAFGKKMQRRVPRFSGKSIVEQYEDYGEANLLVWCAWRLDTESAPVTSSDDSAEGIQQGLSKLKGATVQNIEVFTPAWDLMIHFSNNLCLKVFCDHVPGDPSIEGNWDLFLSDKSLSVGPGANYKISQSEDVSTSTLTIGVNP